MRLGRDLAGVNPRSCGNCLPPLPKAPIEATAGAYPGPAVETADPFMTCIFGLQPFAQASALPGHIGLLLLPADAKTMTHGCKKGRCCTALCYLDKHGVHHRVHNPGDSCECGISTGDFDASPAVLSVIIIFPKIDNLLPVFVFTSRAVIAFG
jgi:hypothetical protein